MMYDVSTLCVHKHYVTVYFSHEMSMDDASTNEMMEKGVCVWGGGERLMVFWVMGYGMKGWAKKK